MLLEFSSLFEHFPEAVLLVTLTGEIRSMNPVARRIFDGDFNGIGIPFGTVAEKLLRENQFTMRERLAKFYPCDCDFTFSRVMDGHENLALLIIKPVTQVSSAPDTEWIRDVVK